MNDQLQGRLRDALDAAARTVPDDAPAPGLPISGPERHRPARRTLIALGAAAAVLLVVGVPIAAREVTKGAPGPAVAPCPGPAPTPPSLPNRPAGDGLLPWSDGLPAGRPPTVPYTLTDAKGAGYLQDGDTRVTLPAGRFVRPLERLSCGWLVLRSAKRYGADGDLGVLLPDGQFRRFARTNAGALSPDGTRVAYQAEGLSEIVIAEVATGREVDRFTTARGDVLMAWNPAGVWLGRPGAEGVVSVWRPGSAIQEVRHDGHDFHMFRTTDRMLDQEAPSDAGKCVRVVTLGSGGRLDELMRRCDQKLEATLSPDGHLLVTDDGKAYRVPDNTPTALSMPGDPMLGLRPNGHWENGTQFLLEANIGVDNATGRHVLARCDAVTGVCERIYDDDRRLTLTLAGR